MSRSLLSKPPPSLRGFCVMCNHCHLLLEVTPPPKEGMSDESLLKRLGSLDSPAFLATVAKGLAKDGEAYVLRIRERIKRKMRTTD